MSLPSLTADLDYLRKLVREKSGIVLGEDKTYLVESRLLPVARTNGFTGLGQMVAQMRNATFGALHRAVIDAMTTNETFFFRDVNPWEALAKNVLPDVLTRKAADKRLTIWCAAASTGQEPYTTLMVLRENFAARLQGWDVQFIATDLSNEVLARAKSGLYSQLEVGRGLSAPLLTKYFTAKDGLWQVKDDLRRMVQFKEQNLLDSFGGLPVCDIIFMRNVLIYFDLDTKKPILARARKQLAPLGYLFLGGAETTLNIDDNFERKPFERAGVYQLKAGSPCGSSVDTGIFKVVRPATVNPAIQAAVVPK